MCSSNNDQKSTKQFTIVHEGPSYPSTHPYKSVIFLLQVHWRTKHVIKLAANQQIYLWMSYNTRTPNGNHSGEWINMHTFKICDGYHEYFTHNNGACKSPFSVFLYISLLLWIILMTYCNGIVSWYCNGICRYTW